MKPNLLLWLTVAFIGAMIALLSLSSCAQLRGNDYEISASASGISGTIRIEPRQLAGYKK